MPIEFATSACCFPTLNREQLFDAAARGGFSSVELFSGWPASGIRYDTEDPATLIGSRVPISALHLPNDLQKALNAIDFAARAKIPRVIAHGAGPAHNAAVWLKPLVRRAVEKGVEIVLTNHKGQSIESPDDVQTALDSCGEDAPHVLLEAGHYWTAGHDPVAAFKRFHPRVRLVHIKDLDAGGRSVPFGRGVSPLAEFMAEIVRGGYRGRIVLEIEIPEASPEEICAYLLDGRKKLAALIAEAAAVQPGA